MPREIIVAYIVLVLLSILLVDVFQAVTGQPTISHVVQNWSNALPWLKVAVGLAFLLLWLHLFEGWLWF